MADTEYCPHVEVDNDDGTIHYQGVLGNFDYDPTQFELMKMTSGASADLPASEYEALIYIGNESDGSKIQIPEGLKDGTMMFSGNPKLMSMPKLPDSLENADSMFANCPRLKNVDVPLNDNLKSANFMFFQCYKMEHGPDKMPKGLKDANYMFTNCVRMENTPTLNEGLRTAECMFADCQKLKVPPKLPYSLQEYSGMTYGCKGMDAASRSKNEAKMMKERARFEKQLNRKSLMQHVGSGLSAVMQYHAMRQAGYNVVMAPLMTHMMRKNGQFQKTLTGGMAAMAMQRGGVSSVIMYGLAAHSEKKQKQREISNKAKLAAWDRVNAATDGNVSNRSMKFVTIADKDVKRGFFNRYADMSYTERLPFQEIYGGQYRMKEDIIAGLYANGDKLSYDSKHKIAQYYQDEMSACVAYYTEAKTAIDQQFKDKPAERDKALRGLNDVSVAQMEPLLNTIDYMQQNYQLFNDGDIYNMSKMLKGMPIEKDQQRRPFMQMMYEGSTPQSGMEAQKARFKENHDISKEAAEARANRAAAEAAEAKASDGKTISSRFERLRQFANDFRENMSREKQDDDAQFGG